MIEALAVDAPKQLRPPLVLTFIRASAPSLREAALASSSAVLLVLSFPNFDLWWLAWIGLAPLLFAVAMASRIRSAFVLGLLWGTIFFYGTCWWLTYPMIHYGGVSAWLAYPLLFLPVILVSVFPALACASLARIISRFGVAAIFTAPIMWVSFDWLRYVVTGQVWNAIGYSQAFHPLMILPSRWAGVYAITFIIMSANAAVASVLCRRSVASVGLAFIMLLVPVIAITGAFVQL